MRRVSGGVRPNRTVDGRCMKVRFPSRAKARKKLRGPWVGQSHAKEVYYCEECEAWHLTKQRR